MTPKEKAEELFKNMLSGRSDYWRSDVIHAKQCALIAVDEIAKELTIEISPSIHGFRHRYWQEVRNEIEKL